MAEPGGAQAGLEPLGGAVGHLPVDREAKPFGMAHVRSAVLGLQFAEGVRHTAQLELAQQVVGWMIEPVMSFLSGNIA